MPTATSDGKGRRMHTLWRSRWTLPVFSLFLGAAMLAAMWVGGSLRDGLYSFAVMAGVALILLLGGRSETIRGLRGDGRDERFAMMDMRATAFAGSVVIGVIIVAWLVEVAPRKPVRRARGGCRACLPPRPRRAALEIVTVTRTRPDGGVRDRR